VRIKELIAGFQSIDLWGTDLFAALLAPAIDHFSQFQIQDNGSELTIDTFLSMFPEVVNECENELLSSDIMANRLPTLGPLMNDILADENSASGAGISSKLLSLVSEYCGAVAAGDVRRADEIWSSVAVDERDVVIHVLRMLALNSKVGSPEKKWAKVCLGRISHFSLSEDIRVR
jgi:hypothetical protein